MNFMLHILMCNTFQGSTRRIPSQKLAEASLAHCGKHTDQMHHSRVHDRMQGLENLKMLIRRLDEILKHRLKANITAISEASFIELPAGHALPCEDILAIQTEHLSKKLASLVSR